MFGLPWRWRLKPQLRGVPPSVRLRGHEIELKMVSAQADTWPQALEFRLQSALLQPPASLPLPPIVQIIIQNRGAIQGRSIDRDAAHVPAQDEHLARRLPRQELGRHLHAGALKMQS